MNHRTPALALACLLGAPTFVPTARAADRPDVLFADFEGATYAGWTAAGTAFGDGPARGALPGQTPINGYAGKGLGSSFHGRDKATGTLISPAFTIDRKYVSFLVGGGGPGPRVMIGCFQTPAPRMPFSQSMTVPLELTLLRSPEGPRPAYRPIGELRAVRIVVEHRDRDGCRGTDILVCHSGRRGRLPR